MPSFRLTHVHIDGAIYINKRIFIIGFRRPLDTAADVKNAEVDAVKYVKEIIRLNSEKKTKD